jgi:choline dehydrogenase-like flavoprotein
VIEADVCIVGAGAAGGIMAHELGRRGVNVVVLESGPRHPFAERGAYVHRYLKRDNPWRSRPATLDRHTIGGRVAYGLDGRRVRGVGGSTLAWEGYALRLHASDFVLRTRYGLAEDWPIGYDELEPYYGRAEAALGVAGVADDPAASPRSVPFPLPPFAFSHSDQLFQTVCTSLGIGFHHLPQARNSAPYAGRAQCRACSTCHVCPTGAKATVDLTHIPAAEATGNVRVVPEATVLRLETDGDGRVNAAVYAHPDRTPHRARARVVVLAAGGVENARLLLLSRSASFPDGLANRSGLVGKYFMSHPSIDVIGRMPDRVYPHRIGFSTAMSRQFAVGPDRATRAAFLLEFLNSAEPPPGELAVASRRTGAALRRHVEAEFGRRVGIRVYCEQLPQRANAVTLSAHAKDYFGNPGPHMTYYVGGYERAALDEARRVAAEIMKAMGATYLGATPLSPAAHQIGTHRIGVDPGSSVVDANLRAHDVPNLYLVGSGAFVTASAAPPTLTIAALAIRAAAHIATQLRSGSDSRGNEPRHVARLVERSERREDLHRAG